MVPGSFGGRKWCPAVKRRTRGMRMWCHRVREELVERERFSGSVGNGLQSEGMGCSRRHACASCVRLRKGWGKEEEEEEEEENMEDVLVSRMDATMPRWFPASATCPFSRADQLNLPHLVPFRYSEISPWSQVGRLQPPAGLVALIHHPNKKSKKKVRGCNTLVSVSC